MSVGSLFNIGITAMQTTNQLLDITSNNIANANTPGYTVENAAMQSVPSGITAPTGETGSGVQITDITRVYNAFVNSQLNLENSNLSYWNNYQTGISQVEDVFNEASTTGISPAITQFFTDWQNVAQSPNDQSQRTTLIQDASYLSTRLNTAASSLEGERGQLYTDSQNLVSQVNNYTQQIAQLNLSIAGNPGSLVLEDQRDQLVQKLNQVVKVTTYQDSNGNEQVLLGGTPLVQDGNSYNMSVDTDSADAMHFYVSLESGATQGTAENPDVTSLVTGGQLGADLQLRDTEIPQYSNQLNSFAVNLANWTNYYQKQGYGLNSAQGSNFFQSLTNEEQYTSVDSVNGVFTSPADTFTTGGKLSIKLGDNDATPATVTVAAGSTLQQVCDDINASTAGSKVTAAVVNAGPATSFTLAAGYTIDTVVGGVPKSVAVPGGAYTAQSLATEINTLSAANGLGISVNYNSTANQYTVTSTGASKVNFGTATSIGAIIGFSSSSGLETIGSGLSGNIPSPPDYRISITANDGSLGDVRIAVANTTDAAGSGLNLLANSNILPDGTAGGTAADLSSVSVTDPSSEDPNAKYQIDYINQTTYNGLSATIQAEYQEDGKSGMYWRVQKSDDDGNTWTAINPNTNYDPSNSSTLNESEVNLTSDYNASSPSSSGYLTRTLEFNGIKVQIDGNLTVANSNGQTFAVQLDPNAASDISTVITDPSQVAASTDTFTVNSTNNAVAFNVNGGTTYTAVIPSGSYTNDPGGSDDISAALTTAIQTAYQNATGNTLQDTLSVKFNANTKQFEIIMPSAAVAGDTVNLLWSNAASTAASVYGFSSNAAVQVNQRAVSDTPGLVLTSASTGVPGDNRNATAIADLESGTVFAGTSPVDSYNALVSNVGVKSASATNYEEYESNLVDQLTQRQSEISGVSLDQEAANLVVYQKSYEAAAQVINVANTLLSTLLDMVGKTS